MHTLQVDRKMTAWSCAAGLEAHVCEQSLTRLWSPRASRYVALAGEPRIPILIAARGLLVAERRSVVQVYLSRERLAQAAQAEPGCLVALLPAVTTLGVLDSSVTPEKAAQS